jgi:hypothetical protein
LELEGSQNVRVLLYEDAERPLLRGKAVIEVRKKTRKKFIILLNEWNVIVCKTLYRQLF